MTKVIFAFAAALFVASVSASPFSDAIKFEPFNPVPAAERVAEPVKSTAPVQSQKAGAVEKSNDKGALPTVSTTETKTTNQSNR